MSISKSVMPTLVLGGLVLMACGPIQSTTTPLDGSGEAPAFSLPNQAGEQVTLASLTQEGPAVLVFNRGHR